MIASKLITKIFYRLEGSYFIKRTMGNDGVGSGFSCFSKYQNSTEEALLYKEELFINYYNSTSKIKAFKEYLYILQDNEISKYFFEENNNSLFYKMDFISSNPLQAEAIHKCNLDIYRANYIFHNQDSFDLKYDILGPKKKYTITTSFVRIKRRG